MAGTIVCGDAGRKSANATKVGRRLNDRKTFEWQRVKNIAKWAAKIDRNARNRIYYDKNDRHIRHHSPQRSHPFVPSSLLQNISYCSEKLSLSSFLPFKRASSNNDSPVLLQYLVIRPCPPRILFREALHTPYLPTSPHSVQVHHLFSIKFLITHVLQYIILKRPSNV